MAWIVTPCVKSGRGCEFAWDGSPSALAPANKNLQTDALAPARVNSSREGRARQNRPLPRLSETLTSTVYLRPGPWTRAPRPLPPSPASASRSPHLHPHPTIPFTVEGGFHGRPMEGALCARDRPGPATSSNSLPSRGSWAAASVRVGRSKEPEARSEALT